MKQKIYLDYNASCPIRPTAKSAMIDALSSAESALNASSIHFFGQEGKKIVENARNHVAKLINAQPSQIIFNSGATESNNTIIQYFSRAYPNKKILVSSIEHPSVLLATPNLHKIPVDSEGLIDFQAFESALQDNVQTILVSVMLANNESGVVQDIEKISSIARKYNAYFHSDITQAVGKIAVDMSSLLFDFVSFSSHKIGGPQGSGALVVGSCHQTPVLLFGGGQEKNARAGTENIASIAGFGAAAKEAHYYLNHYQILSTWRDSLENKLKDITPKLIFHSQSAHRIPNTSFFSLPGTNSHTLLIALDIEGIAISNGSACSSGRVTPSHVLKSMGKDDEIASSALRVSMGWATKVSDIDAFVEIWAKITNRLKIAG